jgi:hypothetical protein
VLTPSGPSHRRTDARHAPALGFGRLGVTYLLFLVGMVIVYALIVDRAKRWAIRPLAPAS